MANRQVTVFDLVAIPCAFGCWLSSGAQCLGEISTSNSMVWQFVILCLCNMRIHKWPHKNKKNICWTSMSCTSAITMPNSIFMSLLQKHSECISKISVVKRLAIKWYQKDNDTQKISTKERKPSDSYPRQGLSWICAGLVAWKPLEGGFPTGGTLRSSACLLWRCSPYIDQRCLRYHPEMTKRTLNFTKTKWKHETLEWNFRQHTGTI